MGSLFEEVKDFSRLRYLNIRDENRIKYCFKVCSVRTQSSWLTQYKVDKTQHSEQMIDIFVLKRKFKLDKKNNTKSTHF